MRVGPARKVMKRWMETPAESCGTWQLCQEPSIVFIGVSPNWDYNTHRRLFVPFDSLTVGEIFIRQRWNAKKNMTNLLSWLQFSDSRTGFSGAKPILFIKTKKRIAKFPSRVFKLYFSGLHLRLKQEVNRSRMKSIKLDWKPCSLHSLCPCAGGHWSRVKDSQHLLLGVCF